MRPETAEESSEPRRGPRGRGGRPGESPEGWAPRGRGRAPEPPAVSEAELAGWLAGRLPGEWFTQAPEVHVDRDEITIVGRLSLDDIPQGVDRESAEHGRIKRFREETRDARIAIAREAERRYGRSVAWGVRAGESERLFTNLAAPAMTRLRQPERQVLDTLVDAGVARSRAEALAWCVRLVGQHQQEWINSLREALDAVEQVRRAGPQ